MIISTEILIALNNVAKLRLSKYVRVNHDVTNYVKVNHVKNVPSFGRFISWSFSIKRYLSSKNILMLR